MTKKSTFKRIDEPTKDSEPEDKNSDRGTGRKSVSTNNLSTTNRESGLVETHFRSDELVSQLGAAIAKLQPQVSKDLKALEESTLSLISGTLSIEQLSSQYGEMTAGEAQALKDQLERVRNSISVEIEKTKIEREGIALSKERGLTKLAGIKAMFELQGEAEKVADAESEAVYQGQKRELKDVNRQQDLEYRDRRNSLQLQEQTSRLAHKSTMIELGDRLRAAVRTGLGSDVQVKERQVARKLTKAEQIMQATKPQTNKK